MLALSRNDLIDISRFSKITNAKNSKEVRIFKLRIYNIVIEVKIVKTLINRNILLHVYQKACEISNRKYYFSLRNTQKL